MTLAFSPEKGEDRNEPQALESRRPHEIHRLAVWEINQRDEQMLDRYEGYPSYYIKDRWWVHMNDGSVIEGMIYLMKLIRKSPPHTQYYDGIANAYRRLGLGSQIKTVLKPALERSIARGYDW